MLLAILGLILGSLLIGVIYVVFVEKVVNHLVAVFKFICLLGKPLVDHKSNKIKWDKVLNKKDYFLFSSISQEGIEAIMIELFSREVRLSNKETESEVSNG